VNSADWIQFLRGWLHCLSLLTTVMNVLLRKEHKISRADERPSGYVERIFVMQTYAFMQDWTTVTYKLFVFVTHVSQNSLSQWQCGLRCTSAAACLLRFWFRIPPGHGCLSVVSVVCCQVEVSGTS
jgi:hypothetical protein